MKKIQLVLLLSAITFSIAVNAQTSERENALLECIGGVSANAIYNTYLVIGSVADQVAGKCIENATAKQLMEEQQSLLDAQNGLLQALLDKKALSSADDKLYVEDIVALNKNLKKQAGLLVTFIETGTAASGTAFDEQRKKNWKEIARLLGLKE